MNKYDYHKDITETKNSIMNLTCSTHFELFSMIKPMENISSRNVYSQHFDYDCAGETITLNCEEGGIWKYEGSYLANAKILKKCGRLKI